MQAVSPYRRKLILHDVTDPGVLDGIQLESQDTRNEVSDSIGLRVFNLVRDLGYRAYASRAPRSFNKVQLNLAPHSLPREQFL